MKILTFSVGNSTYGVDIKHVKQVLFRIKIEEYQSGRDYIIGVVDIKGTLYPVVDFGMLLKGQESLGEYFVVLTTSNGGFVGKVDSILGITDISERILDSQMSVSGTLSPYVMGAAKVNGKIIFIVDVEKIIEAI
ncbi:MAG TPA: chemotaxis protein CheW [Thermoprotei archaeon]|nr:chemotaxis protein CheW [Euryarchaeota archaeon]HDJ51007.1 chemotaxis protein CheW [Thermoprotei archaeon]